MEWSVEIAKNEGVVESIPECVVVECAKTYEPLYVKEHFSSEVWLQMLQEKKLIDDFLGEKFHCVNIKSDN